MKKLLIFCLLTISVISFLVASPPVQAVVESSNPQCFTFNRNLIRGGYGQDVYNLQTLLIRENLLHISQPTFYFGNLTFNAVIAFQEKYALDILVPGRLAHGTGYVGLLTRAKLYTLYGCGTVVGQAPVINGISGPVTLSAGQAGSWTMSASDSSGGPLSYSVVWGDETMPYPMMGSMFGSTNYVQTATFSHIYSNIGNYTPIFYVRNAQGNTVNGSLSVHVTSTSAVQPTIRYLQPNYGTIGSTITIMGDNFTSTGNRVKFGDLGSENNPSYSFNSYDNKTIVFAVPSSNYLSCWYSNPACLAPVYMTQPGTYAVSVINANGQSNPVSFTVISDSCMPNWQCGWGACSNGYQSMTPVDMNHCDIQYQNNPSIACPALARVCQ